MVDLLVDTEFIKIGKNKYMNKLSNGIIYSEEELRELLRKNNRELHKQLEEKQKEKVEENKVEIAKEEQDAIKPKTIQSNRRYKGKRQARN